MSISDIVKDESPISETVLKDVIKDLDNIEEKSGLKDAYSKHNDDYFVAEAPPEYSAPKFEKEKDNYIEKEPVKQSDNIKTFAEAVSDHNKSVYETAQKEIAIIKEKNNLNLPYVNFDKRINDAKTSMLIMSPAMWQFMYEVSGVIQF